MNFAWKTALTATLAFAGWLAAAMPLPANAQAEKSLDKCLKTASKNSAGHVKARTKAIAKCLQKISGELIKKNAPTPAGAAKPCASALRKLVNTTASNKTVAGKAKTKMRQACDPAVTPGLAHNSAQVLSLTPPGVAEGPQVANLDTYCGAFGGDGDLDSVEEWADCQIAAGTCEANQQIGVDYPRAIEWLTAVRPAIEALGADPKYTDALTALDEVVLALDSDNDLAIDINCGPGVSDCGNGTIDANEECDGTNLNGETCTSVGFPDGGTLGCKVNCGFNYQGCSSGTMSKTGQVDTYQSDDDGDIEAGPPFSFVDNLNGTISDQNTGLIWEKLSDDSGVHDRNNGYTWTAGFTDKIDKLNNRCDQDESVVCASDADCIGVGGECGFAGYRDWRIPNRNELSSLLDLGTTGPAMRSQFNNGCTLGCTVLSCSCGPPTPLWSSTTDHASTSAAWYINMLHGHTTSGSKGVLRAVRAVRGPD